MKGQDIKNVIELIFLDSRNNKQIEKVRVKPGNESLLAVYSKKYG